VFIRSVTFCVLLLSFCISDVSYGTQGENTLPPIKKVEKKVIKGAGILPFFIDPQTKKTYVLIAKRAEWLYGGEESERGYVNFGGLCDLGECDKEEGLAIAAIRETYEETAGYLTFQKDDLKFYVDLQKETEEVSLIYRMFLVKIPSFIPRQYFLDLIQREKDLHKGESIDFQWVQFEELMEAIGQSQVSDIKVHALEGGILYDRQELSKGYPKEKEITLSLLPNFYANLKQNKGQIEVFLQKAPLSHPLYFHGPYDLERKGIKTVFHIGDLRKLFKDQDLQKTWFFFDLDDTLFIPEEKSLLLKKQLPHDYNLSSKGPYIEEETLPLLKFLLGKKASVFGLTKRRYPQTAYRDVRALFDDLAMFSFGNKSVFPMPFYKEGVIYTGNQLKAYYLLAFLKNVPKQNLPKRIVFIDNLASNVVDVVDLRENGQFKEEIGADIIGVLYHPPVKMVPYVSEQDSQLALKQRETLLHSVLTKAELNKQFKELHAANSSIPGKIFTPLSFLSPSLLHLKMILGSRFHPTQIEKNLEAFWGLVEPLYKKMKENPIQYISKEKFIQDAQEMLIEEQKNPHKIVAYHGMAAFPAFLMDFYTTFLNKFLVLPKGVQKADFLRLLERAFLKEDSRQFKENVDEFKSQMDLILKQEKTKKVVESYNYLPGYQEQAISVNWFLLGNFARPTSCSYLFYLAGKSIDVSLSDIKTFETLFHAMGLSNQLSEKYAQELRNIYEKYFPQADSYGRMLQIFIDPLVVDEVSYLSERLGWPLVLDDPIATPSAFIESLKKSPSQTEGYLIKQKSHFKHQSEDFVPDSVLYLSYMEGRLWLNPQRIMDGSISFKMYETTSLKDPLAYKKELEGVCQNLMKDFVLASIESQELFKTPNIKKYFQTIETGITGSIQKELSHNLMPQDMFERIASYIIKPTKRVSEESIGRLIDQLSETNAVIDYQKISADLSRNIPLKMRNDNPLQTLTTLLIYKQPTNWALLERLLSTNKVIFIKEYITYFLNVSFAWGFDPSQIERFLDNLSHIKTFLVRPTIPKDPYCLYELLRIDSQFLWKPENNDLLIIEFLEEASTELRQQIQAYVLFAKKEDLIQSIQFFNGNPFLNDANKQTFFEYLYEYFPDLITQLSKKMGADLLLLLQGAEEYYLYFPPKLRKYHKNNLSPEEVKIQLILWHAIRQKEKGKSSKQAFLLENDIQTDLIEIKKAQLLPVLNEVFKEHHLDPLWQEDEDGNVILQ
jgi:8-oxo-dGTP pyrophosphatase MutT (NUDIX family)